MKILYTVDVQKCFYDSVNGNLYVPEAEDKLSNIFKLNDYFYKKGYIEIGSADAHLETDEEFKINGGPFNFHGLYGTEDAMRPVVMDFKRKRNDINYWDEINKDKFNLETLKTKNNIFLKNHYDVRTNKNFNKLMRNFVEISETKEIYIAGFATDYCVKAGVEALLEIKRDYNLDYEIYIVNDAITGIDKEESKKVLVKFIDEGVKLINTDEVII